MTEDQRQQWRKALATRAAQQRQQRHRAPARGLAAVTGPGMVRRPPDRAATVARLVQVALTVCPSIAVARQAITDWEGHPADPAMKADALELLDRIEQEARTT